MTKRGGDVRLVRRLVGAESDVPVDPEDLARTVRGLEFRHQRKHRLAAEFLVALLVCLEPVAVVVGRQLVEEVESLGRESREHADQYARAMSWTEHDITIDGVTLHYHRRGSG